MRRKPLIPYVHAWVDPKGRIYHYFRRRGFQSIKLPGRPFSPEFMAAYQQAMASATPAEIGIKRSVPGSVSAAIAAYYKSREFRNLASGTQAMRRAILERFRNEHGGGPIGNMPLKFIQTMLDKLEPHAARNWFKAIRALCQWLLVNKMIKADPTAGMKLPKVPKSDGRHSWIDDEIAKYEGFHPIGSKARLAHGLGFYTIQRNSDVIGMGPQHISNGWLTVRQKKTGTVLQIPVQPALQAILDATPTKHLTFLVTKTGKPYRSSDLSEQFRVWCNEAGLPTRCTFHGLRKAGAAKFAEAGFTDLEIMAWGGWKSISEVRRYTKAANQKRLAQSGLAKLMKANVSATLSGKPDANEVANTLITQEKK
jgi:site-specific recombinase XerC